MVEEAEVAAGFEVVEMAVDVDVVVDVGVGVGGVGGLMRARASLPRQCGCAGEELRVELVGVGLFCARAGGLNCLVCGVLQLYAGREGKEAAAAVVEEDGELAVVLAMAIEAGCAAAVASERRALKLVGPADSRNGAGNESWWDRILLVPAGRVVYLGTPYCPRGPGSLLL